MRRARRLTVVLAAGAVGLAAGALTGCTGDSMTTDPGTPPTGTPPADVSPSGRACPTAVGPSTGPASRVATVQVSAPGSAPTGSRLSATATLVVTADSARVILHPATSGLALLRDDVVVAWAGGDVTNGTPVPMPLRAGTTRPAQVVPAQLALTGCDGHALPAGSYVLRAVLGYGTDSLDAGTAGTAGTFRLVSDPVPVTLG